MYRAVDLVLSRSVAVKTLPWLIADENPKSVARFEREARAAAALNHPAVVAVYDTGADASTHFIVMELVGGRSLEALLREHGPLDPDRAVGIAERVADALAAAHRAGIVHRDIKPANVMVADDGSVKVLDFGIARARGASSLTQTSSVLGTAAYMAPEQALGKPADERSDIYSLGCVLYAMLTGHPPFTAGGFAAIMHQQANNEPDPPDAENPRVSPALSTLVMHMLGKAPEDRPPSATDVRNRLAAPSGSAADAGPATARLPEGAPTARLPEGAPTPARASRGRLIAAGVLATAIVAIALVILTSGGSSPHPAAVVPRAAAAGSATAAQGRARSSASSASKTAAKATAATRTAATRDAASRNAASRQAASRQGSAPARTPATATPQPTASLRGDARALTTLISRDVRSGAIDAQAARQIATGLTTAFGAFETGGAVSAEHQLASVAQQVSMLEQHGQIRSAAAPPLSAAFATLGAALAHTPPQQAPAAGPHSPGVRPGPPGHGGGLPPGQARRFGHHGGPAGR